ncbi:MAG TPA: penicillin-binding transpeptidase domain-containing protein [Polyangiaceae bacterium]|nr:penicillin-binding transpeptidase domain-containing protein [Polyangiaceae bacterium]
MAVFGRWIGVGAAAGIALALVPVVRGSMTRVDDPLHKIVRKVAGPEPETVPSMEGLDLLRLDSRPHRVTAPLSDGRTAELTLDPVVQRAARTQMQRYRIPEAGTVVIEVSTGKVLAYASYVAKGEPFDVNARASAPAASLFKVVTGAALVEKAGLRSETEQCYHGGRSRILPDELRDDPLRDKWCATVGIAMGRSLNVVFGRLAQKHLTPEDLTAMGGALGFGAPVPFPVPNEAPRIQIPSEPLDFARTSAGFWNTTISPLAAAVLAQTVANGGVALEPRIIAAVTRGKESLWKDAGEARVLRRAIKGSTATEVSQMMTQTVANGSAYKAFHDGAGKAYLPGIDVAGKTGTLSDHESNRHYTWFIGFAPSERPEVAISTLVVNNPTWHIKASQLAREVLRAYFAGKGKKGVTPPS